MKLRLRAAAVLAAALTLAQLPAPSAEAITPVAGTLKSYNISKVYVAGVSSGGYMATQLQLAYSGRIKGAAIFAAGPYYCAQMNVSQALYGCGDNLWPTHLSTLEADAALWSGYGWIDSIGNLSGQPVYVYHGGNDSTVKTSVTNDLVSFYRYFGANVQYDSGTAAGHAWVSPLGPNSCSVTASPFVNNCGTDPQQALLAKLYGTVNPRNGGALTGTLIRFDQNAYATNGWAPGLSMGADGFAYVPASCAAGASCRLLVALHGCSQAYTKIGMTFVATANLNEYADTNDTVVLYPQATATAGINPYGCWDWWGYLGAGDTAYPIHGGAQLETVMNMIRRLDG